MAEQDIKMNQFPIVTDAAYIYAEAANGSQVKIKKSDLVELIKSGLGYSYLKNNPNEIIEDCNAYSTYIHNGLYTIKENTLNRPPESNYRAILLILSRSGYNYQEYIEVTTGKRYYRYYTLGWSEWKPIILT